MKTPMYCIVGERPVKAILEPDGFGVYALNWETGNFDLDLSYLERIYFGSMDEVEELSQDEFEKHIEMISKERLS